VTGQWRPIRYWYSKRATVFDQRAQEYDDWFDEYELIYRAEVSAVRELLPRKGIGIEVGAGTGRFSVPLGIRLGVDPSGHMAQFAHQRGMSVCQAVGERLPFRDGQFDFVLMVTVICFVADVYRLLQEVRRVLKTAGRVIIGFVD
jgi:ubiquinone/menaquinone biosynthesis C-methylase UbiE